MLLQPDRFDDLLRVLHIGDDFVINGDARQLIDLTCFFKRYRVIYADPPWKYADQRKVRKDGKAPTRGIGACHHYNLMTLDDIKDIPVHELTNDRCHLYLWATMPLLPQALDVMRAWRFSYATIAYAWIKLNPAMIMRPFDKLFLMLTELGLLKFLTKLCCKGPGFYTQSNIELVLLGVKQRLNKNDAMRLVRTRPFYHDKGIKDTQIVLWPRMSTHSKKPILVADSIARMYSTAVPRLEMFSRAYRNGWDHFGNELLTKDHNLLEYGDVVTLQDWEKETWQIVR